MKFIFLFILLWSCEDTSPLHRRIESLEKQLKKQSQTSSENSTHSKMILMSKAYLGDSNDIILQKKILMELEKSPLSVLEKDWQGKFALTYLMGANGLGLIQNISLPSNTPYGQIFSQYLNLENFKFQKKTLEDYLRIAPQNILQVQQDGQYIFCLALKTKNDLLISMLLEKKASINCSTDPLIFSLKSCLVKSYLGILSKSSYNFSKNKKALLKLLSSYKPNECQSPLLALLAKKMTHFEFRGLLANEKILAVEKFLLEKGENAHFYLNIEYTDTSSFKNLSPLLISIYKGNRELFRTLTRYGADIFYTSFYGQNKKITTLAAGTRLAIIRRRCSMVSFLKDLYPENKDISITLQKVLLEESQNLKGIPSLDCILERKWAQINYQDATGMSALMHAAQSNLLENVRYLLSKNADKNLQNKKLKKAIDLTSNEDIKKLLQ